MDGCSNYSTRSCFLAIFNYWDERANHLQLRVGDVVYIEQQNASGWYCGRIFCTDAPHTLFAVDPQSPSPAITSCLSLPEVRCGDIPPGDAKGNEAGQKGSEAGQKGTEAGQKGSEAAAKGNARRATRGIFPCSHVLHLSDRDADLLYPHPHVPELSDTIRHLARILLARFSVRSFSLSYHISSSFLTFPLIRFRLFG